MVTYYVDLEDYERGTDVMQDYVTELSSEGASEMASAFLTYVCTCTQCAQNVCMYVQWNLSKPDTIGEFISIL